MALLRSQRAYFVGLKFLILLGAALILSAFFLGSSARSETVRMQDQPKSVLYDLGDPQKSVGVIGNQLVELGSLFEDQEVAGFESGKIVLRNIETQEGTKWIADSKLEGEILKEARHLFVAKQMKTIFEAQQKFFAKYRDHFAPDLETLIHEEFLADGFEDQGLKQHYFFKIIETSADFGKDPKFRALAAPEEDLQPELFFTVDELGLIRFAESESLALWGPVWEYSPIQKTKSEYVGAEQPS